MEPLPETRAAFDEFVDLDGTDPEELLITLGTAARHIVPDLVGLSFGLSRDSVTCTLVASDSAVAVLDAAQYVDGGPCVEVGQGRTGIEDFSADDPLDEERWRLFSEATAARGVASTLSLPLYDGGEVVGSVNLYASTARAFAGHVEQLAALVGAAPTEAVTNADLSFSTRLEAAQAPKRLQEQRIIETAIGLIAGDKGIDVEAARDELTQAAARAGIHILEVARVLISVYTSRDH